MIPAIVIWLYKQYKQTGSVYGVWSQVKTILLMRFLKASVLILIALLLVLGLRAQPLQFFVVLKGDTIGTLNLVKEEQQELTKIKVSSIVKTKMFISIRVNTDEESLYRNGVLVYSQVNRKVNNREPVMKKTKREFNGYQLIEGDKYKWLASKDIRTNIISLYFNEPRSIDSVYCDNHQKWAVVQKRSNICYRVVMPDGNYNDFYYSKGVCTRVEILHSFYKIILLPNY